MTIAIIGAGVGGLVTALSLHRAGFDDIRVYERVRELRPLGVGINLLPHAVRELTELGLRDDVEAIAAAPRRLGYFNRHGQPIWSEPRGTAAGYRWPQLSVHRGELQLALVQAVRARLGADTIRLGHRLTGLDGPQQGARAESARAVFETADGEVTVDADLVIGADGIHSAVRALRYPDEGAPRWNGLTLWRGTAIVPAFLDGATMVMAGDDQLKFVAYPLRRGAGGSVTVNFIAEQRSDGSRAETADWNRQVPIAPIAELFRAWRFDWLDVPAVISNARELLEYPMVDRDPLPRWTFGRSTLLGDAAHAMYPNGSNGASQAILDARTLAYSLATAGGLEEGLRQYEEARRPATADLLALTRQQGPERVMVLAHERAPEGFADITDVIPAAELQEIADGYKRAAGFHPEALNTRASLDARVGAGGDAGAGASPATASEALMTDTADEAALDTRRLAALISPLRRSLLALTRETEGLPDVPDSHVEVLRALPRGTVSTPGALALRLGLRKSTMSNLLTAMEAAGLVVRRPSQDDRRRVEVLASPLALSIFDRFDATSARLLAEAAATLRPDDIAALTAAVPALERLGDALADRRRHALEGDAE